MQEPALYSIIRFVGDIARNEPVNVGLVVWYNDSIRVQFDDAALVRARRLNPRLEPDALIYWKADVIERIEDIPPKVDVADFLRHALSLPARSSEPIPARLDWMIREGLSEEDAIDRLTQELLDRLVHLPTRATRHRRHRPHTLLHQKLLPLIHLGRVLENHEVVGAQTGRTRKLDFFRNSGVDTGLDIFPVGGGGTRSKAEFSADSFRSKAIDLLNQPDLSKYVLYVPTDQDVRLRVNLETIKDVFLTESNSEIVTSLAESVSKMSGPDLVQGA